MARSAVGVGGEGGLKEITMRDVSSESLGVKLHTRPAQAVPLTFCLFLVSCVKHVVFGKFYASFCQVCKKNLQL